VFFLDFACPFSARPYAAASQLLLPPPMLIQAFVKPLRPEGRIVVLADLVLEEVGKPGVAHTILGEEHPLRHPVRKEQGDIRFLEDGIHRIIHEDVAVQGSVDIPENLVVAGMEDVLGKFAAAIMLIPQVGKEILEGVKVL
jgi:hypothetical protein